VSNALATIGLFGAISYSVSERKKELGIRVALGAQPRQLLTMILRQTLVIAGTGVAIGILLGVGITMLVRSQFYEIGAVEWSVLVPVGVAMLAVSLLVAYLSARPWITINPMESVRHA
jgi:ABC-type antimicrobial peptide transport system permease subunit